MDKGYIIYYINRFKLIEKYFILYIYKVADLTLLLYWKKMSSITRTIESVLLLALAWQCFVVLFIPSVFGQDYVDECPEPNGFYADAVQCDRYYECKDSQVRV